LRARQKPAGRDAPDCGGHRIGPAITVDPQDDVLGLRRRRGGPPAPDPDGAIPVTMRRFPAAGGATKVTAS